MRPLDHKIYLHFWVKESNEIAILSSKLSIFSQGPANWTEEITPFIVDNATSAGNKNDRVSLRTINQQSSSFLLATILLFSLTFPPISYPLCLKPSDMLCPLTRRGIGVDKIYQMEFPRLH